MSFGDVSWLGQTRLYTIEQCFAFRCVRHADAFEIPSESCPSHIGEQIIAALMEVEEGAAAPMEPAPRRFPQTLERSQGTEQALELVQSR